MHNKLAAQATGFNPLLDVSTDLTILISAGLLIISPQSLRLKGFPKILCNSSITSPTDTVIIGFVRSFYIVTYTK